MTGIEYTHADVPDQHMEPDEDAEDTPECGGCSKAYRNACYHCSDYDG